MGIAPTETFEEAGGSNSRQEEVDLGLFVLGSVWSCGGSGALYHELGLVIDTQNKKEA